jgi:hypothetical protein
VINSILLSGVGINSSYCGQPRLLPRSKATYFDIAAIMRAAAMFSARRKAHPTVLRKFLKELAKICDQICDTDHIRHAG